jgi:hypothetical protein
VRGLGSDVVIVREGSAAARAGWNVVLGHARPKLLRTYMPTLPLKEAREMLEKWGEEIEKSLAGAVGAQGQAQ